MACFQQIRTSYLALGLALAGLGCGPAADPDGSSLPGVGAGPPAAIPPGMFEVTGVTTDTESGETRRIEGALIIAGSGQERSATFHMTTQLMTPEGPLDADLIGTGEGRIQGAVLEGRAETQMFLAAIPGLDPKFPWIPSHLGPKTVSSFRMSPAEAGGYDIEIETRGAAGDPGQGYGVTRTSLRALPSSDPGARASARP